VDDQLGQHPAARDGGGRLENLEDPLAHRDAARVSARCRCMLNLECVVWLHFIAPFARYLCVPVTVLMRCVIPGMIRSIAPTDRKL
jgi:hypothetical protein